MKNNKKGFTLAELLIVVAIIAVLVAISIPIFSAQLEKAKEATDAANIRAAYAEVVAAKISGDTSVLTKSVVLKQGNAGWSNAFEFPANLTAGSTAPVKSVTATVTATDAGATTNVKLK